MKITATIESSLLMNAWHWVTLDDPNHQREAVEAICNVIQPGFLFRDRDYDAFIRGNSLRIAGAFEVGLDKGSILVAVRNGRVNGQAPPDLADLVDRAVQQFVV